MYCARYCVRTYPKDLDVPRTSSSRICQIYLWTSHFRSILGYTERTISSPNMLPTSGYPVGPGGKGGRDLRRMMKPTVHEVNSAVKTRDRTVMVGSDEQHKMEVQGDL